MIIRDARSKAEARDEQYPPFKREAGPFPVRTATAEWLDGARTRALRVKAFRPIGDQAEARRRPLVLLSAGLAQTRDDGGFLAEHWASHGYITLVVEHEAIARNDPPRDAARSGGFDDRPEAWRAIPLDLRFALDQALRDPALATRVDRERIGVFGQGMGAFGALAVCGVSVDFPQRRNEAAARDVTFLDPRFRALIVASPPSEDVCGLDRTAWQTLATPALHVVGTADETSDVKSWRDRLTGYRQTTQRDQFLITIRRADAADLNDAPLSKQAERGRHPATRDWLRMTSMAFWDSYLLGDSAAQQWLLDDLIEGASARAVKLDSKNVTPVGRIIAPDTPGAAPPP